MRSHKQWAACCFHLDMNFYTLFFFPWLPTSMQGIFRQIPQKGNYVDFPYLWFFRGITSYQKGDAAFLCLARIGRKNTVYCPIFSVTLYCSFWDFNVVFPDICKNGRSVACFCIYKETISLRFLHMRKNQSIPLLHIHNPSDWQK